MDSDEKVGKGPAELNGRKLSLLSETKGDIGTRRDGAFGDWGTTPSESDGIGSLVVRRDSGYLPCNIAIKRELFFTFGYFLVTKYDCFRPLRCFSKAF